MKITQFQRLKSNNNYIINITLGIYFSITKVKKGLLYDKPLLSQQLDALLTNETNFIANLSNASALLYQSLSDINLGWFYLYDETNDELHLGPFQGKVACMHIKNGSGVCCTALQQQKFYA